VLIKLIKLTAAGTVAEFMPVEGRARHSLLILRDGYPNGTIARQRYEFLPSRSLKRSFFLVPDKGREDLESPIKRIGASCPPVFLADIPTSKEEIFKNLHVSKSETVRADDGK
jgi:hypothetical protein